MVNLNLAQNIKWKKNNTALTMPLHQSGYIPLMSEPLMEMIK
jgi:hypothetical protein